MQAETSSTCTNGLTSVERMGAVLGNFGRDDITEEFKDTSVQVIVYTWDELQLQW